jgi:hypothetical protein
MVLDCWAYAFILRIEAVSPSETSIIELHSPTFQKIVDSNSLFLSQYQFLIRINNDLFPLPILTRRGEVAPVLNEAPRLEIVWGSGDIASHNLNVATGWKWLVSFTPRPLHPQGKSPHHPLGRRVVGFQNRKARCGESE